MATEDGIKVDIVTLVNKAIEVYNALCDHEDPAVQAAIEPLSTIDVQFRFACHHLETIAKRAFELEDSKLLKPCSMLGLLEASDGKPGEVR